MFKDYCNLIIERKSFKHLMIFTNGLFNDEICDYLASISKKIDLAFLFNVNDPE